MSPVVRGDRASGRHLGRDVRSAAGAGAVGLVLALSGCAADDNSDVLPPDVQPTSLPTPVRPDDTAVGTVMWRTPVSVEATGSHRIAHVGSSFVVTVAHPDNSLHTTLGDLATGLISNSFAMPPGSNWPVYAEVAGTPVTITATLAAPGGPSGDNVRGLNPDGSTRWELTGGQLGQPAGTSLDAELADGDRLVVRARTAPRPAYDDAPLWLVDAASGEVLWRSPADMTPRWVDLRSGLLMFSYRSDADREQPNDRVSVRSWLDGAEVADYQVADDMPENTNRLCGGIISPTRVLACGVRAQGAGRAILADPRGAVVWRGDIADYPVIDAEAGLIALGRPDGSVEGVDAVDAAVLWRWSAAEVAGQRRQLSFARQGVFIGSVLGSETDDDVISTAAAGRTGDYLFVGPFFRLSDRSVSGSTVLQFADGDVIATTGDGVPVGDLKPPAEPGILYVRP